MRRLDHSMIFFLIAGTYTPFALLVMHGALATAILVVVWAGAIAGAIVEMVWIGHPKWVSALVYLSIGWVAVVAFPELWDALGPARRLAAGRRRAPLHRRRRRLRDPAARPEPGDLRLPRGLPRLRDRRRGAALLGDRLLGAPQSLTRGQQEMRVEFWALSDRKSTRMCGRVGGAWGWRPGAGRVGREGGFCGGVARLRDEGTGGPSRRCCVREGSVRFVMLPCVFLGRRKHAAWIDHPIGGSNHGHVSVPYEESSTSRHLPHISRAVPGISHTSG